MSGGLASLLFLVPLTVWLRYSEGIASAGGLYAFVDAAAGVWIARIQAAFWIFSYALYLVYTGPYIVDDVLPVVWPGIGPYQPLILALLTLAIGITFLGSITLTLWIMAVIGFGQVLLTFLVEVVGIAHLGLPVSAFIGHANFLAVVQAAGGLSILYVCASLPIFLGGEVAGGSGTIRRGLGLAFAIAAVLLVIGALSFAAVPANIAAGAIPGVALARAYIGGGTATVIGIGVAVSVAGLVIAEFIALSRLLSFMLRKPTELMVRVLAAGFVVAGLLTLLNPRGVYTSLLKPSLIALWISQLIVVAVFPRFAARTHGLRAGDVVLAAAASALMLYGVYNAATSPPIT